MEEAMIRCEGCGHPMSDGTWDGDLTRPPKLLRGRGMQGDRAINWTTHLSVERPDEATAGDWMNLHLAAAASWLRAGEEPPAHATVAVHWSPCDEGCRHDMAHTVIGGVARTPWDVGQSNYVMGETCASWPGKVFEASWRQVDVRFANGWPHDLRTENLRLWCLRCEAARG